jgi:predicted CXXCH cytochrome family protein
MSVVTGKLAHELQVPVITTDPKTGRHFEIFLEGGKLYESESAKDSAGNYIFDTTQQLQWLVGSGANAIGAIVKRGDYLFEAPLSLYTQAMTWAPSPGFESIDLSFSRPALEGCLYCHSGRANPVPGTNGRYLNPPFSQLAIGCENCHGPGSAHVAALNSGAGIGQAKLLIVNPAKLSPILANNICEGCHEIGDERVLQPDKSYLDIRPGIPLSEYLSIFVVPPDKKSPPPSDHLQQYYEMTLSKCYRASGGALRCITCHDPHIQLTAVQAPGYFNNRCMTCHAAHGCTLPLNTRMKGTISNNCIGCHMPQRPVSFIAHYALTDHQIIAKPGESLPDSAFHQTTAALPDLVNLDPAPGKKDVGPPLLTLLQAYGELAIDRPEYLDSYLEVLKKLSVTEPNHALVQAALGRRYLKAGEFDQAMEHLQRSLQLDPMDAVVYADLSSAMEALGHDDEALVAQLQAVKYDPYNPILQKRLVVLYINRKRYADAENAMDRYLRTFPQDLFMRRMLALAKRQAR